MAEWYSATEQLDVYRDAMTGGGSTPDPEDIRDRVTRLGRACAGEQTSPGSAPKIGLSRQGRRHAHTGSADRLRDVILGGQDGLVNILGIVLGVISGGGNRTVLLAAGFAAAITESISMGAVGFTSTTADRDFFKAQRAVEEAAVRNDTDLERREITELYRSKGFSGPLLDEVVATITMNRDKWVETILQEERHLQPVSSQDIMRSSAIITLATLIGHLIPLLPFVFLERSPALVLAVVSSGIVLFGVGAYQAFTRVGSWWKQGTRMVLIGLGAAALGFAIGHLFHASGA
jgi:VIT1/CCC1 family predicted Fe2+/Mn2+ transporter